ncbi:hypothetical protein ABZ912_20175 [Nonomuraea angiospora]
MTPEERQSLAERLEELNRLDSAMADALQAIVAGPVTDRPRATQS